jgi:hypothetical protein
MRDITVLHPAAQYRAPLLVQKCAEQGIRIKIGECYRTVKEQDDKYAQGRTAPGIIVTKCKGSTYSSMHQWYIAFDVFLDMDIDGDGKTSDDSYNDKLSTFRKIGKIGESIGLEWGGDWRSVTDKPHFQLPDWGSTPLRLKRMYGTPEAFMESWYPTARTKINAMSSRKDIIWLQTQLTKCVKGCTMKADGIYGNQTAQAVIRYWIQLGWNSKDSGTQVGLNTINALAQGRKE